MAIVGKQEASDAPVRRFFESQPGAAPAGIEKPVRLLRQQLGLIARAVPRHQLVALAEDRYLSHACIDVFAQIGVVNIGIDLDRRGVDGDEPLFRVGLRVRDIGKTMERNQSGNWGST